jgi:DNA invertase Pin-like site-specific DNA recombinase
VNTTPTTFEQRAVVYLRIASNHPNDASNIAHQREGCHRIATRHGLTVVREYRDVGRSAQLDQQIELLHLLDDLHQRRDVAFVIVWDYARLARSMEQLNLVIHHIHFCGADVLTITGMEAARRFVREQQDRKEVAND